MHGSSVEPTIFLFPACWPQSGVEWISPSRFLSDFTLSTLQPRCLRISYSSHLTSFFSFGNTGWYREIRAASIYDPLTVPSLLE